MNGFKNSKSGWANKCGQVGGTQSIPVMESIRRGDDRHSLGSLVSGTVVALNGDRRELHLW